MRMSARLAQEQENERRTSLKIRVSDLVSVMSFDKSKMTVNVKPLVKRELSGTLVSPPDVYKRQVQMTPYQGFPFYRVRVTDGSVMDVSVDDMFVMRDLNPVSYTHLDVYKRQR